MPNLFLIDGVPGSGKSELLKHCSEDVGNIYIKKYTTKIKDNDGYVRDDLICISEEEYINLNHDEFFQYQYPKRTEKGKRVRYLIKKAELEEALKCKKNVFLIVRSPDVIQEIRHYFAEYVNINIVSIFTYCDSEKLKTRTREQLVNQKACFSAETVERLVERRLSRNAECIKSYYRTLTKNPRIYDYVIINNLEQDDYFDCIDNIVESYVGFDTSFLNPKVFVIMPMPQNREGAHFFRVKEAIYKGAKMAGFSAVRQDDQKYKQNAIISDIQQSIKEATVCIADLTNSRPNCYFESGLAFAKSDSIPTILFIAEKETQIDFDLSGIKREEYIYSGNNYDDIAKRVYDLLEDFKSSHIFPVNKSDKADCDISDSQSM